MVGRSITPLNDFYPEERRSAFYIIFAASRLAKEIARQADDLEVIQLRVENGR
jgi:hypothetical protein